MPAAATTKGIVLTRATLMDRVWGFEAERENRTLDVHIRTLRVKLGAGRQPSSRRCAASAIRSEARTHDRKNLPQCVSDRLLPCCWRACCCFSASCTRNYQTQRIRQAGDQRRRRIAPRACSVCGGESYLASCRSPDDRVTWIAADGTVLYDNMPHRRSYDGKPSPAAARRSPRRCETGERHALTRYSSDASADERTIMLSCWRTARSCAWRARRIAPCGHDSDAAARRLCGSCVLVLVLCGRACHAGWRGRSSEPINAINPDNPSADRRPIRSCSR